MARISLRLVAWLLSLISASGIAEERSPEPLSPTGGVVNLFNGRDLSGLSAWLKDSQRADPKQVFTVHDGMIHVSGEGLGYLATEHEYRDYRLVLEYQWGQRTDGGKYVRNSGVLLHATGPDGNAKNGAWMASIECQLAQGCAGDLIPIRGKLKDEVIPVSFKSETVLGLDKRPRWKTGGDVMTFTGRQLWWSRHDPDFKELLDTRGKDDVESSRNEWTKVECVCEGDRITVIVNGHTINHCFETFPAAGKILLQCEGHEIFFRKFELHPLKRP
ncbi:MAG: DUF1080 domain-containing protein [Planctomycetes bacterium]|nr:DUF1080 domain-containing protein [Planctomycetota bacterium]